MAKQVKKATPPGPEYDGPSGEELTAGSLAEFLEQQGLSPHDPASSPPGPDSPSPPIPDWFRKASDSI